MRYLLLFIFTLFFNYGFAQNPGEIFGIVYDSTDQKPLDGVIVEVLDKNIKVLTNDKGEFTIPVLAPGKYVLFFQNVRYRPFTSKDVEVKSDRKTNLNIPLIKFDHEKTFTIKVPVVTDHSAQYYLKIVKPDSTIDYKIIELKPDPNMDYKVKILDPKK